MPVIGCGLDSFAGSPEKSKKKFTINIFVVILLLLGYIKFLIKR
jgi:hypothetical protein